MLPPPRKWKKKKLWHRGRRFCRRERQFPFRIQTMTDASFPWRQFTLRKGFIRYAAISSSRGLM